MVWEGSSQAALRCDTCCGRARGESLHNTFDGWLPKLTVASVQESPLLKSAVYLTRGAIETHPFQGKRGDFYSFTPHRRRGRLYPDMAMMREVAVAGGNTAEAVLVSLGGLRTAPYTAGGAEEWNAKALNFGKGPPAASSRPHPITCLTRR